jgi:hypothetical protein
VASAGGGASSAGEEKARAGLLVRVAAGLGIACVCGELKPGREEGKR